MSENTVHSNLLVVDNVSKVFVDGYREFHALDSISFTLQRNEVLGIIGESGSGKSTIAKIIMGLYKADRGHIIFEDSDICAYTNQDFKKLYTKVQMVFQDATSSFNPRRTIGQSIGETVCQLCAEANGSMRACVEQLLIDVGLQLAYADKYPHELSGGECQRAAIARAMAVHPQILICDEATSALDVSAQAHIVELLLHLKELHNMSLLFITHDLPLVSALADRLVIMNTGKIVEMGDTKTIIENPKSEYTKKLLDAVL